MQAENYRTGFAARTGQCRGADSRVRRNACDSYRVSIKWCAPIASVAALSERPVGEHSTAWGRWCTTTLPDVSLRGAKRRGNLGKALAVRTGRR